jgi:hypothetical protein
MAECTFQRSLLLARLGRVEPQKLGKLTPVLRVLVNTQFDILSERLVELCKVVLILRNLLEHVHALLDDVLSDDFEDLVLLEGFSRDVEGEIFGIDDSFDEVEVFGDEVFAIVHDEDTSDVEFDVVALLLGLEEIEWCTVRKI